MGSESRLSSVDFCLFDSPLNPRELLEIVVLAYAIRRLPVLRKIVLSVVILLLLISGGSAQGETYQLPVRVHTLVACNQGALALTYTGEVFYVEEKSTAVQLTPMFADGELYTWKAFAAVPMACCTLPPMKKMGWPSARQPWKGKL